jgi:hypothetical protein
MKKLGYVIWVILLLLAGCAQHFYRVNNEQVHLYLKAPQAQSVYFISSLDGFKPHSIQKTIQGTWMVSLPAASEFRYFYLVDGDVYHPPCKCREEDDFGALNCIFSPDL